MSVPYIAEIRVFGFGFAPRGWALCQGQLLPIAQNPALFSLLGTMYGGDGQTTFGLPDLRGRVPVGVAVGGGPGASNGSEAVELTAATIPPHGHEMVLATSSPADQQEAADHVFAAVSGRVGELYSSPSADPDTEVGSTAVSSTGNDTHENMQPYMTLNFAIALTGVFPSRQ